MDNKEITTREDVDVPAIADDYMIAMADQAEKRIDAVIKIKQIALKVTNARDWTDQNGNPYLQVSGSEKIANLFNVSWRIDEPQYEEESDCNFTYSIKGVFSLGPRTIEVQGTRSSKDPFFNRYDMKPDANGKNEKVLRHPSTIDKGDVKKAALTNLYGNGITRMLGIRNLTWVDLEKYAGITKDMVTNKVSYNQREAGGDKPPISKPQEKKTESSTDIPSVIQVAETKAKVGKGPHKITDTNGVTYGTFSDSFFNDAISAVTSGASVKITYTTNNYGHTLTTLEVVDTRLPGSEG